MKRYILTLDEGTTSARAVLFDMAGNPAAMAQREFTQYYPQPGWVEHDPEEILDCQRSVMEEVTAVAGITPTDIAAVGITNQRETTVVWDAVTGKPVCNAIVWQCRRTASLCERLIAEGHAPYIRETTGLMPDAYFSATKLKWILDEHPGLRERARRGEIKFGTVDTFLMWRLSNGKVHATDYTNASRTMLFDLRKLCWDETLLWLFDIPSEMLPAVCPSGSRFGEIELMGVSLPVCAVAGDQQAALFGQRCFAPGQLKNTYGTGCFLLMNTGAECIASEYGLVTTLAASLAGEAPCYALEGSVFIGGAVIQWLRDELHMISSAAESEQCALRVPDSAGVYVVPAFTGLGAPYWRSARGTISGLTRGSGRDHIVRAALESIAYQTDDLIRAMQDDTGISVTSLKVDGGASANDFLMQFQADLSGLNVIRPASVEATARGVAYLAGLTCGFWQNRAELTALHEDNAMFHDTLSDERRRMLRSGWEAAVRGTIAISGEEIP